MNSEELRTRIENAYFSASQFFSEQLSSNRHGWGQELGDPPCPWTTSQILHSLSQIEGIPDDTIARPLGWLESVQNTDGSWGSQAYGQEGDTPATAWATTAMFDSYGQQSLSGQRGTKWLCENFNSGLTTRPKQEPGRYLQCHFYSLAMALRALARAPRTALSSLTVQEGIVHLIRSQIEGKGWGYQADSPSDPTFTCYVLHGLLDIQKLRGVDVSLSSVRAAVDWLLSVRDENDMWWDWHGIYPSPEAAGYATYILLYSGLGIPTAKLERAINWLISAQKPDGGWAQDPLDPNQRSNNWVSHSVLLGLRAFWSVAYSAGDSQEIDANKHGRVRARSPELESFPIPAPLGITTAPAGLDTTGSVWTSQQLDDVEPLEIYSRRFKDEFKVPITRPFDHTMGKAIDAYALDKVPAVELEKLLEVGGRVEVHGVYPDHFMSLAPHIGLTNVSPIDYRRKHESKKYNVVRPRFFLTSRGPTPILACSVIPGKDYCHHYTGLIRHVLSQLKHDADKLISMYRYPDAEQSIAGWTGLNSEIIKPGDRIVIGYVQEVVAALAEAHVMQLDHTTNLHYESHHFKLPNGSILNTLGVKYCFWGSISQILAKAMCELGSSEIIYVGKLGTLTGPEDIYSRIFSPSKYVLLNHDQLLKYVDPPRNPLLQCFHHLDTGVHISVPTVMEEDYAQRKAAEQLKASSIDNEISQIALAVNTHNLLQRKSVSFVPIHIATDYLRSVDELRLEVSHDLSVDKAAAVRATKNLLVQHLVREFLIPYLLGE